jgi:hypothetical protein
MTTSFYGERDLATDLIRRRCTNEKNVLFDDPNDPFSLFM